jgi:hypothetical protein
MTISAESLQQLTAAMTDYISTKVRTSFEATMQSIRRQRKARKRKIAARKSAAAEGLLSNKYEKSRANASHAAPVRQSKSQHVERRRYSKQDLSHIAKQRCMATIAAGRDADYGTELQNLQSGRSVLSQYEKTLILDRRTEATHTRIDELNGKLEHLEKYRYAKAGESHADFDKRVSQEARAHCEEAMKLGHDVDYSEVLKSLRNGQRPGTRTQYAKQQGETREQFNRRTSQAALQLCQRAVARGEAIDYGRTLAQLRG